MRIVTSRRKARVLHRYWPVVRLHPVLPKFRTIDLKTIVLTTNVEVLYGYGQQQLRWVFQLFVSHGRAAAAAAPGTVQPQQCTVC